MHVPDLLGCHPATPSWSQTPSHPFCCSLCPEHLLLTHSSVWDLTSKPRSVWPLCLCTPSRKDLILSSHLESQRPDAQHFDRQLRPMSTPLPGTRGLACSVFTYSHVHPPLSLCVSVMAGSPPRHARNVLGMSPLERVTRVSSAASARAWHRHSLSAALCRGLCQVPGCWDFESRCWTAWRQRLSRSQLM